MKLCFIFEIFDRRCEMMERTALSVAKYIINKCCEEGKPISNLQLQKILYYVQVAFLKRWNGKPCFSDEIEAWRFGPVVRDVYNKYCGFGALPICEFYGVENIFSSEEKTIVDRIVSEKRKSMPWELVRDTHAPDKAWDQIYSGGFGNGCVIPKDLLKTDG